MCKHIIIDKMTQKQRQCKNKSLMNSSFCYIHKSNEIELIQDGEYQGMYRSYCCFCKIECNPCSQSCGSCARSF